MSDSDTFRNWTARQQALIRWCAETKYTRQPETLEALAKQLGVTSRTLRNWKNKPGFDEAVHDIAWSYLKSGLPEVLAAVAREASKGNVQAQRLYFELTGILSDSGKSGTSYVIVAHDRTTDQPVPTTPSTNGHQVRSVKV